MNLAQADEIRTAVIDAVMPAVLGAGVIDIAKLPDCSLMKMLDAMEVCRDAPRESTETGFLLRTIVDQRMVALAYALKHFGGIAGVCREAGYIN